MVIIQNEKTKKLGMRAQTMKWFTARLKIEEMNHTVFGQQRIVRFNPMENRKNIFRSLDVRISHI